MPPARGFLSAACAFASSASVRGANDTWLRQGAREKEIENQRDICSLVSYIFRCGDALTSMSRNDDLPLNSIAWEGRNLGPTTDCNEHYESSAQCAMWICRMGASELRWNERGREVDDFTPSQVPNIFSMLDKWLRVFDYVFLVVPSLDFMRGVKSGQKLMVHISPYGTLLNLEKKWV